MTMESVEKISDVIGEVTQPTKAKDADGGNFLRVKVVVDLSLPLCHGRLILLENDKQIWVRFKYERPQIYVIGVVVSLTPIRIVSFGLKVKGLFDPSNDNLVLVFVLQCLCP